MDVEFGNFGATNQQQGYLSLAASSSTLAEQKRIVASKIDELMALCDRLEASLTAGEDARSRLLDALLHEALELVSRELEAAA